MRKSKLLLAAFILAGTALHGQTTYFSAGAGYGFSTRTNVEATGKGMGKPLFTVALSRQWKNLEAGFTAGVSALTTIEQNTITFYTNPPKQILVTHYHDYGRSAVTAKLFANYVAGQKRIRYYGGIYAGALFTTATESWMPPYSVIVNEGTQNARFGYESGGGFTTGIQAGVRYRLSRRLEAGAELSTGMAFINVHSKPPYQIDLSGPAQFLFASGTITARYTL